MRSGPLTSDVNIYLVTCTTGLSVAPGAASRPTKLEPDAFGGMVWWCHRRVKRSALFHRIMRGLPCRCTVAAATAASACMLLAVITVVQWVGVFGHTESFSASSSDDSNSAEAPSPPHWDSFPQFRASLLGPPLCGGPSSAVTPLSEFSPQLQNMLARFGALQHASSAAASVAPLRNGTAEASTDAPLLVIVACRSFIGGLGDQLKGLAFALLLALLAPHQMHFKFVCNVTGVPVEAAWQPLPWLRAATAPPGYIHGAHAGLVGMDWSLEPYGDELQTAIQTWARTSVEDRLQFPRGQPTTVVDIANQLDRVVASLPALLRMHGPGQTLVLFVNTLHASFFGNLSQLLEGGAAGAGIGHWWTGLEGSAGVAALPPELRALLKAWPPTPGAALTPPPSARGAYCATPSSTSMRAGHGAGNTNLGIQLLDAFVRPSPALIARLGDVVQAHYARPLSRFVIALHLRTGLAPPQRAAWHEPVRDELHAASRLAGWCAGLAASRLAAVFGAREEVLWVIAADDLEAKAALSAVADTMNAENDGTTIRVASLPPSPHQPLSIVHVDKSRAASPSAEDMAALHAGFVDVYAEHALLSAAHAMVRSRSGFSETAQAWGRIPLVFELDVGGDACVDVGGAAIQTASSLLARTAGRAFVRGNNGGRDNGR